MNILKPMAGLGSRFDGSRFKSPKPLIDIYGKPMLQRAIESFQHEDAKFIFVIRSTADTPAVVELLNTLCKVPVIKIVELFNISFPIYFYSLLVGSSTIFLISITTLSP